VLDFRTMSKEVKIEHNKKPVLKIKGWLGSKYVESILFEDRPAFLVYETRLKKFVTVFRIEYGNKIFRPLEKHECGYMPYELTREDVEYLNSHVISLDVIFKDVFTEVQRYVAAPLRDQVLITGEVILTYCQEWIDTVHFPFFVGETESGKTTALYVGKALAYRCMVSASLSHANIYNFLGTDEEGVGTICEDEAQDIAYDKDKMKIYKGSYYRGSTVPRVIMTNKGREQLYYNVYGCKWLAGENVPNDKAFRERIVVVYMLGGKPQSNLKRSTPEEKEKLRSLRNRLLFWKVQNIEKGFEKIDSGLTGRDQEMWEDFLSIFHGTTFEERAKDVADYYLKQRGESIKESLEARILRILKPMLDDSMEIEFVKIWNRVTNSDELPGKLDERTGKTFYLDETDEKITLNILANIVQFKFQAKKKTRYEMINGKKRKITSYVFDKETVKILLAKYRID